MSLGLGLRVARLIEASGVKLPKLPPSEATAKEGEGEVIWARGTFHASKMAFAGGGSRRKL